MSSKSSDVSPKKTHRKSDQLLKVICAVYVHFMCICLNIHEGINSEELYRQEKEVEDEFSLVGAFLLEKKSENVCFWLGRQLVSSETFHGYMEVEIPLNNN